MPVNWSISFDERISPEGLPHAATVDEYKRFHELSVKDYRDFWASMALDLDWFRIWDRVLDDSKPPFYKWFAGGELNASYLCLDRHVKTPRRNKVAIIWEGEPMEDGKPKEVRKFTYYDLYKDVNRMAYLLKNKYNIKKGDVIGLYLPMIPELPIFMLAAARLGATFCVVFSGFSSDAIAERMNDAEAKLIVTTDGAWRAGKMLDLKSIVDTALGKTKTVRSVLVIERTHNKVNMVRGRDEFLSGMMKSVPSNAYVEPEPVKSESPLYVLYTSGTTGKPKGQVHDVGGYMTLLHATMKWVFDIKDSDVYWCMADIGWVTGHSYIVFGPLMEGATEIMYEGSPVFPEQNRWCSIIERYGVSIFYTSPTAIRGWIKGGEQWVKMHDTSTVRLMNSVGEPINPEAFKWLFKLVGRERVPFGSTWWMTETGGIMISHVPGLMMIPMKPGTNGMPIPGIDADVIDEHGNPQKANERGFLVLKKPWPGMPLTIFKDPKRFEEVYYSKFPGIFYAGDYAVKDPDGYFWVLGRADEVIKVAGHRLGTYELESALIRHKAVAESAVVGVPDEIKGEVPVAFVILRQGYAPSEELKNEIKDEVRKQVGPIASLKDVFFASKLPKTRSAKIMRRVVKAVAMGNPPGDTTTLEDEASIEEIKSAYAQLSGDVRNGRG